MSRPVANLRLFVAVYPPVDLARNWLKLLGGLELPEHRLVPAEQVHLTLLFVGDTPVRQLDDTIESVQRSCAGLAAFTMTPRCLISLPDDSPRSAARLIALAFDAEPTLAEIHTRLVTRLSRKPRATTSREFRPHMTLCRFAQPTAVQLPGVAVIREDVHITSVHVMRSTLSPGGAQHHEVAGFELGS